jgi:hypothetical protein
LGRNWLAGFEAQGDTFDESVKRLLNLCRHQPTNHRPQVTKGKDRLGLTSRQVRRPHRVEV